MQLCARRVQRGHHLLVFANPQRCEGAPEIPRDKEDSVRKTQATNVRHAASLALPATGSTHGTQSVPWLPAFRCSEGYVLVGDSGLAFHVGRFV